MGMSLTVVEKREANSYPDIDYDVSGLIVRLLIKMDGRGALGVK